MFFIYLWAMFNLWKHIPLFVTPGFFRLIQLFVSISMAPEHPLMTTSISLNESIQG